MLDNIKLSGNALNPNEEKQARKVIKKIVLLNAIRYDGKATPKPVFGKLLGEYPQFRRQIKEISPIINEIVQEVNALSLEKQREIVAEKWPEELVEEKTEEKKQLPPLPNVKKYDKIITRFSPNPDFVLHLGSARAILLSYDYAKMYDGIFLLRFEDTDSKTKKPRLEFYDAVREDLDWLGCKWASEFIQSDRLPIYYEHAEELIKAGNAYVCTCERLVFQEKSRAGKACPCRGLSAKENLVRWNQMLDGKYDEGEVVVRHAHGIDGRSQRGYPSQRNIGRQYPDAGQHTNHDNALRKFVRVGDCEPVGGGCCDRALQ